MSRIDGERENRVILLSEEHGFHEDENFSRHVKDIFISSNSAKLILIFPQSLNTVDIILLCSRSKSMSFEIPAQIDIDSLIFTFDKLVLNIDIIYDRYINKQSNCKTGCFHVLCVENYFKCFRCGDVIDMNKF